MKSIYFNGANTPFDLRDEAIPEPGPGEVRIRTGASGVCGTDVHYWNGSLDLQVPWVLGHEPVVPSTPSAPG